MARGQYNRNERAVGRDFIQEAEKLVHIRLYDYAFERVRKKKELLCNGIVQSYLRGKLTISEYESVFSLTVTRNKRARVLEV